MSAPATDTATRRGSAARGFRDRLERWSLSLPWRAKLTFAYVVIAAAFAVAFFFVGFDLAWIREHAWTIIREGLPLTLLVCVLVGTGHSAFSQTRKLSCTVRAVPGTTVTVSVKPNAHRVPPRKSSVSMVTRSAVGPTSR